MLSKGEKIRDRVGEEGEEGEVRKQCGIND
jgi:hypothetical protein